MSKFFLSPWSICLYVLLEVLYIHPWTYGYEHGGLKYPIYGLVFSMQAGLAFYVIAHCFSRCNLTSGGKALFLIVTMLAFLIGYDLANRAFIWLVMWHMEYVAPLVFNAFGNESLVLDCAAISALIGAVACFKASRWLDKKLSW